MKKLYQLFSHRKAADLWGGIVNWSFLQAGMVDELSLFLAPVTDGGCGTASFIYTDSALYGRRTGRVPIKGNRADRGGGYA